MAGLHKRFGGVVAVDSCSLDVAEGSVTGLIGPNGSGKTTLFDLVTGFERPDAGTIAFRGRPITGLPPDPVHRLGIGRPFHLTRLFPRLTPLKYLRTPRPPRGLLWVLAVTHAPLVSHAH